MGLALTLEVGRFPMLVESRIIIPLAVFGFLHGFHEWLEMSLLESGWLAGQSLPIITPIRIGLLAISFSGLIYFGVSVLLAPRFEQGRSMLVLLGGVCLYVFVVVLAGSAVPNSQVPQPAYLEVITRYFIGVVGAGLAAWAFLVLGERESTNKHRTISRSLKWAGVGFLFYALTQTIVAPVNLFPAEIWNTSLIVNTFGFPIQLLRAFLAIWITVSILRTINLAEKERTEGLVEAQRAKVDALEQMQQEMANRELLRKEFLRRIVLTQDHERARISRELHDETAQTLTAFSLNLAALKKKLDQNPEAEKLVLYLQRLNQQISRGIYNIMRDLRPIQLDELGLGPALQNLADQAATHLGVNIQLEIVGKQHKLEDPVENALFRVAQEAINNIARHSGVREGKIFLNISQEYTHLVVKDQGCGFVQQENSGIYHGLGIAGMRERVESVGGSFILLTEPGTGTQVEVVLPAQSTSYTNNILDEGATIGDV